MKTQIYCFTKKVNDKFKIILDVDGKQYPSDEIYDTLFEGIEKAQNLNRNFEKLGWNK